jgi:DNA-directed RNA polymerase specialized sigma54-like protein
MGKESDFALTIRRRYQKVLKREKRTETDIKFLRKKLKKAKLLHKELKKQREDLAERSIALASYGY